MRTAIYNWLRSHALKHDSLLDWWADVLNLTRGNPQSYLETVAAYGIKTDDIDNIFSRLREGIK